MVQLCAGDALIDRVDVDASEGLWARPEVAGGRNLDHVCIAVTAYDEQELRGHLAAHGVNIIEEGLHGGARGNSLSIYFRDPSVEPTGIYCIEVIECAGGECEHSFVKKQGRQFVTPTMYASNRLHSNSPSADKLGGNWQLTSHHGI
jgi:hypothetical protein